MKERNPYVCLGLPVLLFCFPFSLCALCVLFDLWVRMTWLLAIIWDKQVELSLKLPPALNTIQRERLEDSAPSWPRLLCVKYVVFPPCSLQRSLNSTHLQLISSKDILKKNSSGKRWLLLHCPAGDWCSAVVVVGDGIWKAGWCHQGILRKKAQKERKFMEELAPNPQTYIPESLDFNLGQFIWIPILSSISTVERGQQREPPT